jgi:photosystem II stability/assembly factor-like uncharacterized protein
VKYQSIGAATKKSEQSGNLGIFRRLRAMRYGTALGIIASLLVVAGTGTLGLKIAGAIGGSSAPSASGAGTSSNPTTGIAAPVAPAPASQSLAPVIPTAGGAYPGHGAFNAVSCPSATTCFAVGSASDGSGVAALSTSAGSSWSNQSLPSGVLELHAVTCSDAQNCVAVGRGALLRTTNGGGSWAQTSPPQNTTLLGVTCLSGGVCLTTGVSPNTTGPLTGVILRSTDGGTNWSADSLPQATPGLGAIACPTATRCIAVGAAILTSDDAGHTWQDQTVASGFGALETITCSTSTHCVAFGSNPMVETDPTVQAYAVVTNDAGNTWQRLLLPTGTSQLDRVTCPTSTQCYAGGPSVTDSGSATFATSQDGGTTWSLDSAPGGISSISSLSCAAATSCVVVGLQGPQSETASTSNATSWSATQVPAS